MKKIITRIQGGLGNQLFCYAAARRLALVNNAELVIDDVTGFIRDHTYRQRYSLDCFNIPCRKATYAERLEPFERLRRGVIKYINRSRPFKRRSYVEQVGNDFDFRLLDYEPHGTVYLDGLWQGEGYFKDVEQTIRQDLCVTAPTDKINNEIAVRISDCLSVAVHVRWFDAPCVTGINNATVEYYIRAIAYMEKLAPQALYFIFSDDPESARTYLPLPMDRSIYVSHNRDDTTAYADLWLMSQCNHFITANSTFSWWGAWLGCRTDKCVITPGFRLDYGTITSWNFSGQLPKEWIKL